MSRRPFFVVNPQSAGGQTGRLWGASLKNQIVKRFPEARWAFTTGEAEAAVLARYAWKEGADLVVAVGGDGSVNEVINGLMGNTLGKEGSVKIEPEGAGWPAPSSDPPRPEMGILPRGTGCDFARSVAVPRSLIGALDVLENGRSVPVDVGEIVYTDRSGDAVSRRHFINIAGCGASGEVVDRVNRSSKRLGGFLSFLLATMATTMRYRRPLVQVTADDEPAREVELNVIFVCNAQYCGGGMRIAPEAVMHDGLFQVVEISATGRLQSLLHGGKLYSGRLAGVPGARVYTARRLRVTSAEEVLIESDGEQPGILPATYTLIPHAIHLRVGRHALAVQS